MSDTFLTFEIDHLYNFQFKYTFVCIYSVYSLALNCHVEREKHKNFRNHLPCLRVTTFRAAGGRGNGHRRRGGKKGTVDILS
jgi:hypothetical protein